MYVVIWSGRLTLISGTDPRSMATMQALHGHWRRLDGGGDDEEEEEEEDDGEEEDGEEGYDDDRSSSSEYSGGGVLALTPRTTTSSSSNVNQHHKSTANRSVGFQATTTTAAASASRHRRLRSSEVCEVAGLSALATGNCLSLTPLPLSLHHSLTHNHAHRVLNNNYIIISLICLMQSIHPHTHSPLTH